MLEKGCIPVLSLSTPTPRRTHIMDDNGAILCGYIGRVCKDTAHRSGLMPPFCVSCTNVYKRIVIWRKQD